MTSTEDRGPTLRPCLTLSMESMYYKKFTYTKLIRGGGQGEGPPIGFKEISRVEESYQLKVYFNLIKANV